MRSWGIRVLDLCSRRNEEFRSECGDEVMLVNGVCEWDLDRKIPFMKIGWKRWRELERNNEGKTYFLVYQPMCSNTFEGPHIDAL